MKEKKMCVLDESKVCDDCGECNRCDLDPEKICDNCCRCIAIEDEGKEFRSRTIVGEKGIVGGSTNGKADGRLKPPVSMRKEPDSPKDEQYWDSTDGEPTELTPELVDYWEKVLVEHGEAPADDGFGELDVRTPIYGSRKARPRKNKKHI